MAVIVWYLNLQLPIQSVPITTDVVSQNLGQGEVYSIHYVIKFASENGVKHYQTSKQTINRQSSTEGYLQQSIK